jgi:hypothetical protein
MTSSGLAGTSRQPHIAWRAAYNATCRSRVALAMARLRPRYIAFTMFSVTFLASPSSIMVLSR